MEGHRQQTRQHQQQQHDAPVRPVPSYQPHGLQQVAPASPANSHDQQQHHKQDGEHPITPVPSYQSSPYSTRSSVPTTPRSEASSSLVLRSPRSTTSQTSWNSGHDDEMDIDMRQFKREIDVYRERGAHMRALTLLDDEVAGEQYKKKRDAEPKPHGLTAKQAFAMQYEEKKRQQALVKAKLKEDQLKFGKREPKLVVPRPKEQLAETTRRRRTKTEGDVATDDIIHGMKCQLDLDREKEAQRKALKLLREGYLY